MQNLLEQPKPSIIKSINQVLDAIQEAAPIPAAHKRSLPHDIRDLSALLTEERGAMGRPYWAAKNLFSAYIHYFMPWNLYRLSWLLPSLPLDIEPNSFLVDLGSGPLTLPLALWCSKPELRQTPLRFLCTDVANQPMEQGLAVFNALTKGQSPWVIECVKAPIETALIKLSEKADIIMAGNVLNELQPAKGQTLQERIGGIIHSCSRKLKEGGNMLFVEPGTRLGGKVVIMAREAGQELGLSVLAPCSHQERCPLAKDMEREERLTGDGGYGRPRGSQMASQTNMWCHFSFPVQGAPARLSRLTAAAKFDRRNLALSCLMMTTGDAEHAIRDIPALSDLEYLDDLEALYDETLKADQVASQRTNQTANMIGGSENAKVNAGGSRTRSARSEKSTWEKARYFEGLEAVVDGTITPPLWARIISGPIRLPKEQLPARYGCCAAGLVLVRRCERIPYGAAVEVTWERLSRDEKSGALMVDMILAEEGDYADSGPRGGQGQRFERQPRGRRENTSGKSLGKPSGKAFGSGSGRPSRSGQRKYSGQPEGQGRGTDVKGSTGSRGERGSGGSRDARTGGKFGRSRSPEKQDGSFRNNPRDGQLSDSGSRRVGNQATASQQQVDDFQSFFGRPQKMRERYGGLPQNLRNTPESTGSHKTGLQGTGSKNNRGEANNSRNSQRSDGAFAKGASFKAGREADKSRGGEGQRRKGKTDPRQAERKRQPKDHDPQESNAYDGGED